MYRMIHTYGIMLQKYNFICNCIVGVVYFVLRTFVQIIEIFYDKKLFYYRR